MPDWLLWLLPVPLATAGAIGWTAWSSRARGPQDTAEGVAEYERFRAALARRDDEPRPDGTGPSGRTGSSTTRGRADEGV